ncbi:MAG: hypothetical protein IID08_06480 [Candidatus Hydrogenedentes bacterium]|nr:hypothetical protein [Candidatus Hydrogenedentota bacterium]
MRGQQLTIDDLEPVDMVDGMDDDPMADDVALGPVAPPTSLHQDDFLRLRNRKFDIKLRQEGFIAESKIKPLGRVDKSEKPVRNLSQYDEVYLKFKDASRPRVGQKFTIYRQIRRVKHPIKRSYVGYLIRILGQVEIISTNEKFATGKIFSAYAAIHRGDPITEYVSMVKTVNITPNTVQLEGHIIETLADGAKLIGSRDVIYIDRGAQDGVRIGNKMQVVRRGDPLVRGDKRSLPDETVGTLVVVGTRANTSTVVVTEATRALHRGDRVVMK